MDHDDFVLVERHDGEGDEETPCVTPEDLERIRSWLAPTEFESEGSEYRKHLNAHVPGTGDWLFQTDQYKTWHDCEINALWIQGIPGSGKSVVAANLIQELKQENAPILFFFSRRIIKSNSEPRFLVRDCLYQFLDHSVALQSRLKRVIEQHPVVGNVPFHELWRILLQALSAVPRVYVLLDALDELAVEEDGFLRCLLELGQISDSIKLLMTSRPLPHLQTVLKGPFLVNIRLAGRRVENDIATYITHRMAMQKQKVLTDEDQSAIRDVLCQKGQGLFLYARLMLDELLQQSTPVHEQLRQLPSSLEEMYVELLKEHSARSGASLNFQSLLLSWITHASRPLRVTELAALVNSFNDRGGLNDSQDTKPIVRTACGPLLEILDDETVQVIHHSFTEFLLDNSRVSATRPIGPGKWFPAFKPALVHRSMTLSCVDYLISGCFKSLSIDERPTAIDGRDMEKQRNLMVQFHFLQYASQNLIHHAKKCDALDAALASKLDRFFQYGSHNFETWKDFFFAKENEITPDDFHPLHIAARAGLTAYAAHILEKGVSPDLVDSRQRTATAYAAMHGHPETLTTLLGYKAVFTMEDEDCMAPIHHAAKCNHINALQCLLNAGVDPTLPKSGEDNDYYPHSWNHSTLGKTPIEFACELGNADVVSELLHRLEPGTRSGILPHWAAVTGQANILSTLLQYPQILANINKKDVRGNTALYLAACSKDSATVRILLEHGADVHLCSDELTNSGDESADEEQITGLGRTPLQGWANIRRRSHDKHHGSIEEWEKTGALLIEAGSDIEVKDEKGQTILFAWTAQPGYGRGISDRTERFVSLLLKYGADPCAIDNEGNTALHHSSRRNQSDGVIALLVNAGADINAAREEDLVTPLIAAAKMQCVDVKAYVDNGADPNLQDSEGNTALHRICRSWCFKLSHVQEWLMFADPTIKNNKGNTCLYNLRWGNGGGGRVEAIPLLVEKGLDLESRNRLGRTALLSACQMGEPHFIHGLLRYGANARSRDFQNKSCLHIVATVQISNYDNGPRDVEAITDVIKALNQAGTTINDVDFDGNTPFHDAVESSGHFTSVKIRLNAILKFGGVANASNHRGQTALHKVAALRNSDQDHYAHKGVAERIDFLLQESLGLDLHTRDNEGIMPIHIAAAISEVNTWKFIKAGADLRAQANNGRNPLHFAAETAQSNTVGLLCKLHKEKSWPVDQRDETGRTALHYAACSGSSECVYQLLQSGADPNMKDKKGLTPLHAAAEHEIDTVKLRKHRKYDSIPYWRNSLPGKERLSPYMDMRKDGPFHKVQWRLDLAIGREEEARMIQDVVRLLLSAGGDPAVLDKSGQTAYDVAVLLNNEEVAGMLSPFRLNIGTQNPLVDQWHSIRSSAAVAIVQKASNIEGNDSYTLLQSAISLRNEAILDVLLKTGVDPISLGPDGLTPAHTIAHFGLVSMMKILACHVEDLNVFSPPLLHVAASRELSNIQMVDLLIERGVNVSASYQEVDDERRRSTGAVIPSYAAAHILAMGEQWWNIAALESLCKAGADLEMTDGDGNTVLQCALNGKKSGSWGPGFWRDETLEVLLKHGANINALSPENGQTPLLVALESRRGRKLIQKLLDCGADINLGDTPALLEAIESEDPVATEAVLDAGADFNAIYHYPKQPRNHGRGPKVETPLLSAAMKTQGIFLRDQQQSQDDRIAIQALLLKRGANPLMKLQDGDTTVLHEISRCHGLIAPIVKAGFDLEIRDSQGRTPLLAACSLTDKSYRVTEDESTTRELILAGVDVNSADNTGSTPLHLAAQSGLVKTVTLLLKKGASTSAANNAGLSPLYYALSHSYFRLKLQPIKDLLSAGANPLISGPNGETPLHLLAPSLIQLAPAGSSEAETLNYGHDDKTDYLSQFKDLYQRFVGYGCDHDARDNLGNTPLFPYVEEVKHRCEYYRVNPPAEEDLRKTFDEHNVFAVNDNGDTLLHAVAGRKEDVESVPDGVWLFQELMGRGIDPRQENKKGVSALDVAAACGKDKILALFAREE